MRLSSLLTVAATLWLSVLPAMAKVLAESKPVNGFYWQKVEKQSGKIVYLCRSQSSSKIQKGAACSDAGAVRPE